ncbi:MAG: 50S ribosomal protein L9 [Candidatus Magasanikbacteria bacterium GW2011_GWC2_40_17]|uniref:Large ribosomal subunit protein bL9 n=1 Tax=Candidatus Magasanikbacteria bacterium GW2011_GWA2_42_32 TaxID=1619039 RepID=A0A0G1A8X4_9BACT|nr:MAG: 50S ribosomal protein L9 [Candidatus Magasanikbacteria bacterium GW2011_GWC2_40_17]KKS57475.1 MAG: 50S ribosomal protein L9 [Candidatus Magasanikbacteria bacterium GW2011_GWA2_42_32]OGH85191.1 MAG: 50S ribosomal protein L9 [Candidatus Magasanikbacteria bacterium RIFOXYB2_FULL_38_10]
MKVLLRQEVPGLGHKGEVKEVAEGYGRNFLLAQNKAVPATTENLRNWETEKNKVAHQIQNQKEILKKIAGRLQGLTLEFEEKTDDKGQLFGGISSAHLVATLSKIGLTIEKNQIVLDKAFKKVGKYPVKIKLGQGIAAEIKVIIKSQ